MRTVQGLAIIGLALLVSASGSLDIARSSTASSYNATQFSDPGMHRTYWLTGGISSYWNGSSPNPGPWVNASDGDTLSIILRTGDTSTHNWYLDFNNNGVVDPAEKPTESPDFNTTTNSAGGVNFTFTVSLSILPHGGTFTYRCLYHSIMSGRFRFNAGPLATFTHSPPTPLKGHVVNFNASQSWYSTNASSITGYNWNFGDGNKTSSGSSPIISHVYTTNNTYAVVLNITDNLMQQAQYSSTVKVVSSFDYQITVSPSNQTIVAGESLNPVVSLTLTGGTTQNVTLTASIAPKDSIVQAYLDVVKGLPPFNSVLHLSTAASDLCPPDPCFLSKTYTITIMAVSGTGLNQDATFTLTLKPYVPSYNYIPIVVTAAIAAVAVIILFLVYRRKVQGRRPR